MKKIVMGSAYCMRNTFYRDGTHIFIYPPQVETENNQVQLVKSMKFTAVTYRTMGKELATRAHGNQRQMLS